jgi:Amt family ammonium transporter
MNRLLSFLEYRPRLCNILSFCGSLIVMLLLGVGKVTAQDLNNSTVDSVAESLDVNSRLVSILYECGFCHAVNGFLSY